MRRGNRKGSVYERLLSVNPREPKSTSGVDAKSLLDVRITRLAFNNTLLLHPLFTELLHVKGTACPAELWDVESLLVRRKLQLTSSASIWMHVHPRRTMGHNGIHAMCVSAVCRLVMNS